MWKKNLKALKTECLHSQTPNAILYLFFYKLNDSSTEKTQEEREQRM